MELDLLTPVSHFLSGESTSGLYYKHTMIVSYNSSVVNKLTAFFTDDARVIIYDRYVFIVQATAVHQPPPTQKYICKKKKLAKFGEIAVL
jgi:hypothetical protein